MYKNIISSLKTEKHAFQLNIFFIAFVILFILFLIINMFIVPKIINISQHSSTYFGVLSLVTFFTSCLGAYITSTRNIFDNHGRYPPAGVYSMILFFLHVNLIALAQ